MQSLLDLFAACPPRPPQPDYRLHHLAGTGVSENHHPEDQEISGQGRDQKWKGRGGWRSFGRSSGQHHSLFRAFVRLEAVGVEPLAEAGEGTVTFGEPLRFTRERPDEIVAMA
jgi:hypothetical protein